MRRTIFALVSTVVALVLLLSFKTQASRPGRLAALGPAVGSPSPVVRPSPVPIPSGVPAARPAAVTRTVTGAAFGTPYGPVQVQLRLVGTRIVRITAVHLPSGQSRDAEINGYAVPILTAEALRAQSARIDTVSGATYTSDGYARSLQSALDAAHA